MGSIIPQLLEPELYDLGFAHCLNFVFGELSIEPKERVWETIQKTQVPNFPEPGLPRWYSGTENRLSMFCENSISFLKSAELSK